MAVMPGARPSRGVLMLVSIGAAEAEEWRTDPAYRERALRDLGARAIRAGRKYLEVRGARGELLAATEVSR